MMGFLESYFGSMWATPPGIRGACEAKRDNISSATLIRHDVSLCGRKRSDRPMNESRSPTPAKNADRRTSQSLPYSLFFPHLLSADLTFSDKSSEFAENNILFEDSHEGTKTVLLYLYLTQTIRKICSETLPPREFSLTERMPLSDIRFSSAYFPSVI